jgi:RNA-binding protein
VRGKRILYRIGQVLHVSRTKNLILKAENIPKIGDNVTNEKLNQIGKVLDIFGPTSSPYVAIKTKIQNPNNLVNQVLYSFPSRVRANKRKKR